MICYLFFFLGFSWLEKVHEALYNLKDAIPLWLYSRVEIKKLAKYYANYT